MRLLFNSSAALILGMLIVCGPAASQVSTENSEIRTVEQQIAGKIVRKLVRNTAPSVSNEEIVNGMEKVKSEALKYSNESTAKKLKVTVAFNRSLSSKEVIDFARNYGLELLQVEFYPFNEKTKQEFGYGLVDLTEFAGSTLSKLQSFKERHSSYIAKGTASASFTAADRKAISDVDHFFAVTAYAPPGTVKQVLDVSYVSIVRVEEEVSPERYERHVKVLKTVEERELKRLSGQVRESSLLEGETTGSEATSNASNSFSGLIASRTPMFYGVGNEKLGNLQRKRIDLKLKTSTPALKRMWSVANYPYPCQNVEGDYCPNDSSYKAVDRYSYTRITVYGESYAPNRGPIVGVTSSTFGWNNLAAYYYDPSLYTCNPEQYETSSPPYFYAKCTYVNGTYVSYPAYEHQTRIYNPECLRTNRCIRRTTFFTDLPFQSYEDYKVGNSEFWDPAGGTDGAYYFSQGRDHIVYFEFASDYENMDEVISQQVRVTSQILTTFGRFQGRPAADTVGIDTTGIVSYDLVRVY